MAGTAAVSGSTVSLTDNTGISPAATKNAAEEQKAQFLTLLVTQLRYQDPLNPMQGTEFTQQLAMFSSLEQLININKSLGKLGGMETAFAQGQAVGMLGKQVLAEGNTVTVTGGTASNLAFSLDQASTDTLVNVFGPDGALVGVFDAGNQGAGSRSRQRPSRAALSRASSSRRTARCSPWGRRTSPSPAWSRSPSPRRPRPADRPPVAAPPPAAARAADTGGSHEHTSCARGHPVGGLARLEPHGPARAPDAARGQVPGSGRRPDRRAQAQGRLREPSAVRAVGAEGEEHARPVLPRRRPEGGADGSAAGRGPAGPARPRGG
ncbi:MAG: hypothetical protein HYT99_01440 [Candidatus Tectomicrobia bacterium]|nr:hypothetical protein [Candidatus Tectomicrobia bacterium]